MKTKHCSKCKKILPIDEFHIRGTLKSGETEYQSMCKECARITNRESYKIKGSRHRELNRDNFKLAQFVCY